VYVRLRIRKERYINGYKKVKGNKTAAAVTVDSLQALLRLLFWRQQTTQVCTRLAVASPRLVFFSFIFLKQKRLKKDRARTLYFFLERKKFVSHYCNKLKFQKKSISMEILSKSTGKL
jgi:hypothetical protein